MNKITFNANGKTGTIFLNNPENLNSFDFEMIKELDRILERIKSSNLNVVVIKGKGKAFCSGGNISWEQEVGDNSTF